MKFFTREQTADSYIYISRRLNHPVAWINLEEGKVLTQQGLTDNLTDDEWIELIRSVSACQAGIKALRLHRGFYADEHNNYFELIRLLPYKLHGQPMALVRYTGGYNNPRFHHNGVYAYQWQLLSPILVEAT